MTMPTFYNPALLPANPALDYRTRQEYGSYDNSPDCVADFPSFAAVSHPDLNMLYNHPYSQYKAPNLGSVQSIYPQASQGYHHLEPPMIPTLPVDQRFISQQLPYQSRSQGPQQHYAYAEAEPPRDEKPSGGVSAKLDYQMNQMTEFVAEMSVGMYELFASRICIADIDLLRSINPNMPVTSSYKKWVLQLLSATRLPSATILQSLSYLALRLRGLSANGDLTLPERGVRQMLTVAMMLGSKFLDDNTFQNKSWSDVSLIPTAELNKAERDWLSSFGHRLHNDIECPDGYLAWEGQWASFLSRSAVASNALRPIDTNVHPRAQRSMNALSSTPFSHQYPKTPVSSYTIDTPYSDGRYSVTPAYSPFDNWYRQRAMLDRSPSTAPQTGPHTPDYGQQNGWAPPNMQDVYQRLPCNYGGYAAYTPPEFGAYTAGYASNRVGLPVQPPWNCHGIGCPCHSCRQTNLASAPRFGQVAVS